MELFEKFRAAAWVSHDFAETGIAQDVHGGNVLRQHETFRGSKPKRAKWVWFLSSVIRRLKPNQTPTWTPVWIAMTI